MGSNIERFTHQQRSERKMRQINGGLPPNTRTRPRTRTQRRESRATLRTYERARAADGKVPVEGFLLKLRRWWAYR